MRIQRLLLWSAFTILIAAPSLGVAASQAPSGDPEDATIQELVVTARENGPAWWRVNKGDATAWIIGAPLGLPKGYQWDSRAFQRRLSGANHAITPAIYTGNIFDIPALLSIRSEMRSKSPLEDTLPPDLRARFLDAVQSLHQSPNRYDHWNALYAGILMMGDFNKLAQLDRNEPLPTMIKAMRSHGLKPAPAAAYKDTNVLKQAERELSIEVEQTCLAEALDEIEGGPERQRHAAEGWDHGDSKIALKGALGFGHCLNLLPSGAKMSRQSMSDEAEAIRAALLDGGTTIAVMPLRQLVAEHGVLDQLKSDGFTVRAPNR